MRITYRQVPPLPLFYARSTGPYRVSCAEAWQMLTDWLERHGLRRRVKQGYGIFRDDPATTDARLLRYDACIPVMLGVDVDLTGAIGRQTLRGGGYAVHTHVGAYADTGAAFSRLRREVVPRRGLSLDNQRPFLAIYLNDPMLTREMHRRTELCVPVIPLRMPLSSNDDDPRAEAEFDALQRKA